MQITTQDGLRTLQASVYGGIIGLDIEFKGVTVTGSVVNFHPAEARALGEWLLENAPKPPTNQEIWDAFPIGQRFQFADGNPKKFVKVSAEKFCGPDANFFYDVSNFLHIGFKPLNEEEN